MDDKGVLSRAPSGPRRRFLLVVDSDAKRLSYTAALLQRFRYNIWTARSAAEALDMASTCVPALIVIAQNLSDMPGLKLIHQLKRSDSTRAVPVIVLMQKADPGDERACLTAWAVTCLSMPVNVENLYRVIQVAVEPIPRMSIRIDTSLSVTINRRAVRSSEGECASVLSEHGLYVRTPDPYPLNTKIPVQIHMAERAISADAVVIYSDKAGDGRQEPGMGLQFVRISPQDQERIRQFIRDEIARDIRAQRF